MKYTILSKRQDGETLYTTVLYDFDGPTVQCEVAHFQPADAAAITTAILNRAASEQRKLAATTANAAILAGPAVAETRPIHIAHTPAHTGGKGK